MKLIVFTLDALFALLIAVMSLSLLFYITFYPNSAYSMPQKAAQQTLAYLLTTNTSVLNGPAPSTIYYASNTSISAQTWDQYMKNAEHQGGNVDGPKAPMMQFIYSAPSAIIRGIVADYGNIYFGAGSKMYAVNASSGSLLWNINTYNIVASTSVIYSGMLIFSNSIGLNSVDPLTGSQIYYAPFNPAISTITTPLVEYNGKLFFGAITGTGTNVVASYYANNGTLAWSTTFSSPITALAVVGGSLVAGSTSAHSLYDIGDYWNTGNTVFTNASTSFGANSISGFYSNSISGPTAAVAYGTTTNYLEATYIDGTPFYSYSMPEAVRGQTIFGNTLIFQSSQHIFAATKAASIAWNQLIPNVFGSAPITTNPVMSSGSVYSLWTTGTTNYLLSQNVSTGNVLWSTKIPYPGVNGNMTLAYGKLFVTAGGNVMAFGACNINPYQSILYSAVNLYTNKQGGCADALINRYAPIYNYTLVLNGNSVAPSLGFANFNSMNSSYIDIAANVSSALTNIYTVSVWLNTSSWQSGYTGIVSQPCVTAGCFSMLETSASGTPEVVCTDNYLQGGYTVYANVIPGNWINVACSYTGGSGGYLSIFVNGRLQSKVSGATSITRSSTDMELGRFLNGNYFTGSMANLQIYNTSLNQTLIGKTYFAGATGPPLGNNTAAWLPLANNAADYFAGRNNGYPIRVTFSKSQFEPYSYYGASSVATAATPVPVFNYSTSTTKLYNVSVVVWKR